MNREKEIFKVTIIGGIVNAALTAFKFVAGVLGHSSAMMADAVHSLSDFVTDVVVLVFVHLGNKPGDRNHNYGHGKYETLATTIVGIALFAVAAGLICKAAMKIAFWAGGGQLQSPGMLALWAALASIAMKEGVYRYTVHEGKKLNSQALEANAWHHRSDALSSIGSALGIGGAILLGERWAVLDPIASIVVGALIVKVSIDIFRNGVEDLLERSLPEQVEKEILDILSSYPDVRDPHKLCTRNLGNNYAIETHIRMNGDISLSQAHDRASEIENRLKERFGPGTHVTIHIEPYK